MDNSQEQRIQNRFGGFCVKVLKNEANRILNEFAKLRTTEISLDTEFEKHNFAELMTDRYFANEHIFYALDIPIVVLSDSLANALSRLTSKKRDIVLLSYFLGISDRSMCKFFGITHQAVSKQRIKALKELKELLESSEY